MNWASLISATKDISSDEVKELIKVESADAYQLLDVRQPNEYAAEHIPGAILIPLPELAARLDELDPDVKTIVYCRSGKRSKSGCQLLEDRGFSEALNMAGGMLAWQGDRAQGDETLGLELFAAGDFDSAFSMSQTMERGLRDFYLLLADSVTDHDAGEFLKFMAKFEDTHIEKLQAQHPNIKPIDTEDSSFLLEGGIGGEEFMRQFGGQLQTVEDIIHVAMMFESQAYDLYSRLARRESDAGRKDFFTKMAAEEQKHLEILANQFDKRYSLQAG